MNGGFWASWGLFQWSYIGALSAAAGLAALGVLVVGRGRAFLTAAVGQVAALGFAVSALVGGSPVVFALILSTAGALFAEKRDRGDRSGEIVGETEVWLFLIGQALATALLAGHPQGLKAIQAALTSSLINTAAWEAITTLILAGVGIGWILVRRRVLTLFLSDPVTASAVGISVRRLGIGIAVATGLALGWSIPSFGFLFVFSAVAMPTIIARCFCRTTAGMLWLAPAVGVILCGLGLALGYVMDWPFGQAIVVTQTIATPLAWGAREFREWYIGG